MKTTMISFKCPDYLIEYLKKLQKKLDRSRSYMIVKILGDHKNYKTEPLTAKEIREQNKT